MKSLNHILLAFLMISVCTAAIIFPVFAQDYYYHDQADCSNCGTVEDIDRIGRTDKHLGGGTAIGAIAGGILGSTVGKGDGRTAATVAGAVAGGAIGHTVEKKNREEDVYYRIEVRMDNGSRATFKQGNSYGLRPGDRIVAQDGRVEPMN